MVLWYILIATLFHLMNVCRCLLFLMDFFSAHFPAVCHKPFANSQHHPRAFSLFSLATVAAAEKPLWLVVFKRWALESIFRLGYTIQLKQVDF